ncbi:MAG: RNA polymerase factor sigma-54, partial [Pseudomonadota bacterium]|nr:RNA polymerase factor sigma-54 [Pseudomonadota bacterium]
MLKPSLQLKVGQTLTMTPQLQQAIRLLQLPVLDLSAQIKDALEENIMLEAEDLPDLPNMDTESATEIETIKAADSWQSSSMDHIQDGHWNSDSRPSNDFADTSRQTLRKHLLWQLEMEDFSPRESVIGEAIVDAINDDGYLTVKLSEIRDFIGDNSDVTDEEIDQTLTKVQRLDPIGIGARSLSECIVLQL